MTQGLEQIRRQIKQAQAAALQRQQGRLAGTGQRSLGGELDQCKISEKGRQC